MLGGALVPAVLGPLSVASKEALVDREIWRQLLEEDPRAGAHYRFDLTDRFGGKTVGRVIMPDPLVKTRQPSGRAKRYFVGCLESGSAQQVASQKARETLSLDIELLRTAMAACEAREVRVAEAVTFAIALDRRVPVAQSRVDNLFGARVVAIARDDAGDDLIAQALAVLSSPAEELKLDDPIKTPVRLIYAHRSASIGSAKSTYGACEYVLQTLDGRLNLRRVSEESVGFHY
jgi:hypothetical protein